MHQVKGMAQNKGVMLNPREERENAGSTSVIPSVFASKSFPAFHLRTKLCLTTAKLATCIPSKCMQRHNVFVLHFFLEKHFCILLICCTDSWDRSEEIYSFYMFTPYVWWFLFHEYNSQFMFDFVFLSVIYALWKISMISVELTINLWHRWITDGCERGYLW